MIARFLVSPNPDANLGAAVFAVCAISPLEDLDEVAQDLREKQITGRVLFDLLLANGNKVNRYFLADFDGQQFKTVRLQSAADHYNEFSSVSAKFLHDHVDEIDPSLLSKAMQFALRQGVSF
jgi:hypothetical protein